MSATRALNELADCDRALTAALEHAVAVVSELGHGRQGRALALGTQIRDAIELVGRITMYVKADAAAGNPCGFSELIHSQATGDGDRDARLGYADYLIETGRAYQ